MNARMPVEAQFTAELVFHFHEHGPDRRRWFMFGDDCHRRVPMAMDGVEGLNTVVMWADAPGEFHAGDAVTVRCVVIAADLYRDVVRGGVKFRLWDAGFFATGTVLERGAPSAWVQA